MGDKLKCCIAWFVGAVVAAVVAISIANQCDKILKHFGNWNDDEPVAALALVIGVPLGFIVPYRLVRWLGVRDLESRGFEVLPPEQRDPAPRDRA